MSFSGKRCDSDGQLYSFEEFKDYYGVAQASRRWKAATSSTSEPVSARSSSKRKAVVSSSTFSRHSSVTVDHAKEECALVKKNKGVRQGGKKTWKSARAKELLRSIAKKKLPVVYLAAPKNASEAAWAPKQVHYRGLHVVSKPLFAKLSTEPALAALVQQALNQLALRNAFKPTFIVKELTSETMSQGSIYPRRLLVGKRGMTHGSKGHRLFAANWEGDLEFSSLDIGETTPTSSLYVVLNKLRIELEKVAQSLGSRNERHTTSCTTGSVTEVQEPTVVPCNEVLVNFFPASSNLNDLRKDNYCGMDGCVMSWHRDKGLIPMSNVIVYSHQPSTGVTLLDPPTNKGESEETQSVINEVKDNSVAWRVAFKVAWDATTPAVSLPVTDGDAYFMIGDFNDKHQHAVFAGTGARFSLAFNAAKVQGNSIFELEAKCNMTLAKAREVLGLYSTEGPLGRWLADNDMILSLVGRIESCRDELEFGWVRHFWAAGQRHSEMRPWWTPRILRLEQHFWAQLNTCVELIMSNASAMDRVSKQRGRSTAANAQSSTLFEQLTSLTLQHATERENQRAQWARRYSDPIYNSYEVHWRPINRPLVVQSTGATDCRTTPQ